MPKTTSQIRVRKLKACKHSERLVLSFHISRNLISFLAEIFQKYCIFSQDLARTLARYFQELYFFFNLRHRTDTKTMAVIRINSSISISHGPLSLGRILLGRLFLLLVNSKFDDFAYCHVCLKGIVTQSDESSLFKIFVQNIG